MVSFLHSFWFCFRLLVSVYFGGKQKNRMMNKTPRGQPPTKIFSSPQVLLKPSLKAPVVAGPTKDQTNSKTASAGATAPPTTTTTGGDVPPPPSCTFFGEFQCFGLTKTRLHSAIATTKCEMLVLSREALLTVLTSFPREVYVWWINYVKAVWELGHSQLVVDCSRAVVFRTWGGICQRAAAYAICSLTASSWEGAFGI